MYDRVLRRKGKSRGQEVTRVEVRGKFKGAALIGSPSFIAFTIVPAVVVGPAENGQSSQLFSDANAKVLSFLQHPGSKPSRCSACASLLKRSVCLLSYFDYDEEVSSNDLWSCGSAFISGLPRS